MKYFKNTELANLYHVSEKSVRNWIQAAAEGKSELELHHEGGRPYIANTSRNTFLIEQLVQKGKKYKNTRAFKMINPSEEFYKVYTDKQILDIISNLAIHRELPLQYGYVDGGAEYWDQYTNRLLEEQTPNVLTQTIELLDRTANHVDRLLEDHAKVNVVDLGPGNGVPVRSTLARLLEQGKLRKYIAVDISQEMLKIVEANIKRWFGDAVPFQGCVRDFSHERFDDLFAEDYVNGQDNAPANLIFLLGGTLSNFRSPSQVLQTVNNSMGIDDVLLYSGYLDTPHNRRYFDFDVSASKKQFSPLGELVLDYLNVDDSLYDVEQLFSETKKARSISIRPKVDLKITFELKKGSRYVELRKNESLLLWRHRHYDALGIIKQFDDADFNLLQATKSKNQEYLLVMSKIRINDA